MKTAEVYRLLKQFGWQFYRSGKGSHQLYRHAQTGKTLLFSHRGSRDLTYHSQRSLVAEIHKGAIAAS